MGAHRAAIVRAVTALLVSAATPGCVVPLVQSKESRAQYVQRHSLDPDVAKAIRLGKVVAGMTREEVEACWGSPSSIDNSESTGLHGEWAEEVWKYESDAVFVVHPEATVFFRNGKVTEVSPAYLSNLEQD